MYCFDWKTSVISDLVAVSGMFWPPDQLAASSACLNRSALPTSHKKERRLLEECLVGSIPSSLPHYADYLIID